MLDGFGGQTPKLLKLMGTAPYMLELQSGRPSLKGLTGRTFIARWDKKGKRQVTGLQAHLGLSGAYTKEFGCVFAEAFVEHGESAGFLPA